MAPHVHGGGVQVVMMCESIIEHVDIKSLGQHMLMMWKEVACTEAIKSDVAAKELAVPATTRVGRPQYRLV
jgi:hypothetical protein